MLPGVVQALRARFGTLAVGAAGVALVALLLFVVLPGIADPGDVWEVLRGLSWVWLGLLIASTVLNVVTFAPPYMAALPGLRFRPALAMTMASTASTYLAPGGIAVGIGLSYAMLRGWGFRARDVTLSITVVTIWNQFMVFGTPAVALAWLSAAGGSNALLQTAAYAGVAVFGAIIAACVLALSTERLAAATGDAAAALASRALRLVRRGPVGWSGATLAEFRDEGLGLLRSRWHWITLGTLAGHLTVYLVLLVSIRALDVTGGEVSLPESFAAWALVRVLGQIAITPGGFGFVELGLTGALVAFGGPSREVVAAVLLYRFLTVAPPLALGALLGATWRRHHPAEEAP
jgi:uncharacterized membrane protein YbhN (UPF0104 family)